MDRITHTQKTGHSPTLLRKAALQNKALVSEMLEARDERRLLRFQQQMAGYKLLIIDELGFVSLSNTGNLSDLLWACSPLLVLGACRRNRG
ncbi:hypothetical protein H0485_21330 [Pseudogemmobacter sp. CC-YST710]|uniref:Transposase n=1 Tax=Pseudogemmobacter faecipullorum TaxID=2755041 RepID=A0ABS8CSZ1_9RHOB|nr:hypothetical protein [Pseudogemmobacter faecipullorum]MCB5412493.1 hypothetical protein [Pseudogemmobacter faecipullorum]